MSAFNLSKGVSFNLSKQVPGFDEIYIGAGWRANELVNGKPYDVDLHLFLTGDDDKLIPNTSGYVGYITEEMVNIHGFEYGGDNRIGSSLGDAEYMKGFFSKVGPEVNKVLVGVSIFAHSYRHQTFDNIRNVYVRLLNPADDNKEIARFNVSDIAKNQTALILGCFYRSGREWYFQAETESVSGGLKGLFARVGVTVEEEGNPD